MVSRSYGVRFFAVVHLARLILRALSCWLDAAGRQHEVKITPTVPLKCMYVFYYISDNFKSDAAVKKGQKKEEY
jgi:hypothetical protein